MLATIITTSQRYPLRSSREDDVDFNEVLSKFRNAILAELSAQLGRNDDNFRIWQDRFAIPHGALWQKQITDGRQAVGVFYSDHYAPDGE